MKTMGEYVEITSSPAEVTAAAARIVGLGEGLSADMNMYLSEINGLEGTKTWGNDDFAHSFLHGAEGGYQQPVDVGSAKMPANEAVKMQGSGKEGVGEAGAALGNLVVNAMDAYSTTDENSGDDISAA
jgi:hypothetical protein